MTHTMPAATHAHVVMLTSGSLHCNMRISCRPQSGKALDVASSWWRREGVLRPTVMMMPMVRMRVSVHKHPMVVLLDRACSDGIHRMPNVARRRDRMRGAVLLNRWRTPRCNLLCLDGGGMCGRGCCTALPCSPMLGRRHSRGCSHPLRFTMLRRRRDRRASVAAVLRHSCRTARRFPPTRLQPLHI